jgi:hypothetical protein
MRDEAHGGNKFANISRLVGREIFFGEALINRRGVYSPVKTNRRLW